MKGEREFKGTVVHLVPAMEQGGVERVVCNLNRAAVRAGWRSVVISRGGRLVGQIVADGGEHVALDLKSKNPLTYLTRAWKLRKSIRALGLEGRRGEESRRGDARDARVASDARVIVCAHSRVPAWLYVGARKIDSIFNSCQSAAGKTRNPCQSVKSVAISQSVKSVKSVAISQSVKSVKSVAQLPWITYAHGANSVSRYSAVMTRGDRVVVPSKFLAGYLIENYAGAGESGAGDGAPADKTLTDDATAIAPLGLHLHDSQGGDDHLAPGEGKIDFAALLPMAKAARHLVLEPSASVSEDSLRKGLAFLKRTWNED